MSNLVTHFCTQRIVTPPKFEDPLNSRSLLRALLAKIILTFRQLLEFEEYHQNYR